MDQIFADLPKPGAGVILLIVAWVIATILRTIAKGALSATSLDDRLSGEAGVRPVGENLGNVLYWLVILFFLPAVISALGIAGLFEPVEGMVDAFLAMLPNIVAAAAIALVGWFVARILRDLVSNLLGGREAAGRQMEHWLSRLRGE